MRVLFWVIVCFFIFYLGMQTANNHAEPTRPVIQTEADFKQSSVTDESFNDVHEEVLDDTVESDSSSFYSIAVFLEDVVKTLFSVIFQFLYRFSAMFF